MELDRTALALMAAGDGPMVACRIDADTYGLLAQGANGHEVFLHRLSARSQLTFEEIVNKFRVQGYGLYHGPNADNLVENLVLAHQELWERTQVKTVLVADFDSEGAAAYGYDLRQEDSCGSPVQGRRVSYGYEDVFTGLHWFLVVWCGNACP